MAVTWQTESSVESVTIESLSTMFAMRSSRVLATVDAVTAAASRFVEFTVEIAFFRQTATVTR